MKRNTGVTRGWLDGTNVRIGVEGSGEMVGDEDLEIFHVAIELSGIGYNDRNLRNGLGWRKINGLIANIGLTLDEFMEKEGVKIHEDTNDVTTSYNDATSGAIYYFDKNSVGTEKVCGAIVVPIQMVLADFGSESRLRNTLTINNIDFTIANYDGKSYIISFDDFIYLHIGCDESGRLLADGTMLIKRQHFK